jgi:hypothetical protein
MIVTLRFSKKIKKSQGFFDFFSKRIYSIKQDEPTKTETETKTNIKATNTKKPPKLQLNLLKWYLDNAKTPGQLLVKKDIQRGNLWEMHEYVKSRKTSLEHMKASLMKERIPFPQILSNGTNLLGEKIDLSKEFIKNKASIVITTQKRIITGDMADSWRKPLREKYSDIPIYEVMISTNVGYNLLNFYVNSKIKSTYSEEERKNFIRTPFIHRTQFDPVEIGINIENSLFAYVFLLDSKGNVLWKAVGDATSEWLSDLYKYYEKVLVHYDKNVNIFYTDKNENMKMINQEKKPSIPNTNE